MSDGSEFHARLGGSFCFCSRSRFLSIAFFEGGYLIMLLLFVVGLGGSISLFLKAKPMEHM